VATKYCTASQRWTIPTRIASVAKGYTHVRSITRSLSSHFLVISLSWSRATLSPPRTGLLIILSFPFRLTLIRFVHFRAFSLPFFFSRSFLSPRRLVAAPVVSLVHPSGSLRFQTQTCVTLSLPNQTLLAAAALVFRFLVRSPSFHESTRPLICPFWTCTDAA